MTAVPATDPTAVHEQQRALWDGVCPGWLRWRDDFERGAVTVTARLLALAGVAPGQAVLDVGSGVGEPALSAARAVGPTGRVVGVDLSPAMVAAARAAADGADNLEFVAHDVETVVLPAGSFDVALARWSLMFAPDRVELLRAVARLLRPLGVLAAAVWAPPERVPAVSLAFRVISSRLGLSPPPPGPGPFSMSDAAAVALELRRAGFGDVEVHEHVVGFRFDSAASFAAFSRDVLPSGMRQVLEQRCGSVDDPGVWSAVVAAAREHEAADGTVLLPSTCLCLRAVAGGGG
jgi:SAM-dependent methyltransferase